MGHAMRVAKAVEVLTADGALDARLVVPEDMDPGAVARTVVTDVTYDSRAVRPGALFVCKGAAFKPAYLADAVARGAVACLSEHEPDASVPAIVVRDVRRAMAELACAFFGEPSRRLRVVGITGTKGKTTTAYYVDAILRARVPRAGVAPRSGMFTGLVIDDGMARRPSHNTTPESVELQRHLANAVDAGCDVVVMEASSQGLKYDRTLGTRFAVGMFTNIGEDHISPIEHPTFQDYFSSKLRIFAQSDVAVVNVRSDHADEILRAAHAACPRVVTYDTQVPEGQAPAAPMADVRLVEATRRGLARWDLAIATPRGPVRLAFAALGAYNVQNAVAAVAACEVLGVSHDAMARGLREVRVPGRGELHRSPDGAVVGVIDYAHNEMSMRALLGAVREEFPDRQVTVVFGSCGTRGLDRRAGLGRAAGELADRVILTEDEPDTARVADVCAEIGRAVTAAGGAYEVVERREEAIRRAVDGAARPAVVVIAGKGAETTMLRNRVDEPYGPDARVVCAVVGAPYEGEGTAAGAVG